MKSALIDIVRRWTLRARLMALAIFVMVPGFVILGATAYDISQSRQVEVREQAARAASQAASEVERIFDSFDTLLNTLSRAPSVKNLKEPYCSDFLRDLQQNLPQATGFVVVDLSGQFRCGSPVPAPGTTFADQDFFKQALKSGGMSVGTYVVGRTSGRAALPVALAIRDQQGQISSVAITGIDLLWFGQQLRERALPKDGSLMIADKTGIILARAPAPEKYLGTRVPDTFMERIGSTTPGVVDVKGLDGTQRMLGYFPPPTQRYGFYVSAGLSIDESYKAVREAIHHAIYVAIVWALTTLCITWLVGNRFFVRPFSKLLSVIRKWRKGDQSVRIGFADEVGEFHKLGLELDRMIEQIVRDQADKQLLADELMHRIKNTLTMVSALATMTMNREESAKQALPRFLGRIQALAETNDILYAKQWRGADLERLILAVISPLLADVENRIDIGGPEVHLEPREAFGMTMVVHELCTNAIKHGALRAVDGRIEVKWNIHDNRLRVDWSEHGSGIIAEPTTRGFGSKLMTRAFGKAGTVRSHFRATGLYCDIELQLGRL